MGQFFSREPRVCAGCVEAGRLAEEKPAGVLDEDLFSAYAPCNDDEPAQLLLCPATLSAGRRVMLFRRAAVSSPVDATFLQGAIVLASPDMLAQTTVAATDLISPSRPIAVLSFANPSVFQGAWDAQAAMALPDGKLGTLLCVAVHLAHSTAFFEGATVSQESLAAAPSVRPRFRVVPLAGL